MSRQQQQPNNGSYYSLEFFKRKLGEAAQSNYILKTATLLGEAVQSDLFPRAASLLMVSSASWLYAGKEPGLTTFALGLILFTLADQLQINRDRYYPANNSSLSAESASSPKGGELEEDHANGEQRNNLTSSGGSEEEEEELHAPPFVLKLMSTAPPFVLQPSPSTTTTNGSAFLPRSPKDGKMGETRKRGGHEKDSDSLVNSKVVEQHQM